jgi:hypothetical protein
VIINFYSIATLVALLVLVVASWKSQKWVAMTATALLGGVAAVFELQGEYFDFAFYLFQFLLLLLGTAFFVKGRRQKLLVGFGSTVVVTAGLIRNSLQLDHLAGIEFEIYLFAAYALLPLLFYSPVKDKEENLEKTICLQQTWLRVLFFHWALVQGVNISHYDLYPRFVLEFGGIALAVILLAVLWRRRFFWTLVQQTVLSLLVLSVGLDRPNANTEIVYSWILLLALATLLPKNTGEASGNKTRFLKRLEFGAFGGGVFWSLVFVVHSGAVSSVEGSMLWIFIIFLAGFFSWLRDIPAPMESKSATADLFMLGARAFVQVLLASIFIYPF